jgi:hypothetical protein
MKVVFTDEALRELDQIFEFNQTHYPASADAFRLRLRVTERRIARWPESTPEVEQRPGVRVAFLIPIRSNSSTGSWLTQSKCFTWPTRHASSHGTKRKPEKGAPNGRWQFVRRNL